MGRARNANGKRERIEGDDDSDVHVTLISGDNQRVDVAKNIVLECQTLENLMEDAPGAVEIPIPNISGRTLRNIVLLLQDPTHDRSMVSVGELIELIIAVDFFDIPWKLENESLMTHLFNELKLKLRDAITFHDDGFTPQQRVDIRDANQPDKPYVMPDIPRLGHVNFVLGQQAYVYHLPRNLLHTYLFHSYGWNDLNIIRHAHVALWHVTTDFMISSARKAFPKLTQISDAIVLEAAWVMRNSPMWLPKTRAKYLYVLSESDLKDVPSHREGSSLLYGVPKIIEIAILKHGSMQAVLKERLERDDKSYARHVVLIETKQAKRLRRTHNTELLNALFIPHGYRNADKFIDDLHGNAEKEFSTWLEGPSSEITAQHVTFEKLRVLIREHLTWRLACRSFDRAYKYTTDEHFVKIVAEELGK